MQEVAVKSTLGALRVLGSQNVTVCALRVTGSLL